MEYERISPLKYEKVHPFPDWWTAKLEKKLVKETHMILEKAYNHFSFAENDTPLRTALILMFLKEHHIWEGGIYDMNGMWYPAKTFYFECCKKVNAPTYRNPNGLALHFHTTRHLLNLLQVIFKVPKEEIKKELPTARMITTLDTQILEETTMELYSQWRRT